MIINPQYFTMNQLFAGRMFKIPDYQRSYSWQSKQRAELFDDIRETILKDTSHFMATVVGLSNGKKRSIGTIEYSTVEIVDGQQRITTICILLKALELSLQSNDKNSKKTKSVLKETLVKGDDFSLLLLQTNHDSSDIFSSYLRSGKFKKPKNMTTADKCLIDAISECEDFVDKFNDQAEKRDLITVILNRLTIIFHELADESIVYKVFEVLNSRGLEVRWIDKLKSQLMGKIFDLANEGALESALIEMKTIWANIYRILGLKVSLGDDALKFAGTLVKKNSPSKIMKVDEAVSMLIQEAGDDLGSINNVAKFLEKIVELVVELDNDVRKRGVKRVVHARFVAISAMNRWSNNETDRELFLEAWERSTFKIFGVGGADARIRVGDYVRLGHEIHAQKLEISSAKDKIAAIGDSYTLLPETIAAVDDWYNNWREELRYLLARYEESLAAKAGQKINSNVWKKIWCSDVNKSIEHIMPQSSAHSYIHDLGNLALLPPGENSKYGKKKPAEKSEYYTKTGLMHVVNVGNQISQEKKWRKREVAQRSKILKKFVIETWG